MTFAQFLSILRARKWAALVVFGLVVATTVVVSLILPKQYTGTASIVFDLKPDPISLVANPTAMMPNFMATQLEILTSERVALRVIRELKLAESPQIRQQWLTDGEGKGTVEQWLVALLQKQLDARPSRESNIMTVSYKAQDPRFAAGLANAFAQAYIATILELRVDPAQNFKKFFDIQTKDAREALERSQGKLSAFQRANSIIATDERFDVENARLNELSSQLTQLQAIHAESISREVQAVGAQSDRMQEVLNNPVIINLKADLTRAEARLQELTQRLGEANPQVIEAKASIAELRSRLDAEVKRVTGGVGVTNTINKGREAQVKRDLESQRAKVLRLKAVRDEGLVIQREVENAQRVYDNVTARMSQVGMEAQSNQGYANILTAALPPAEESFPKLALNTALAAFLGLLLGVGVALVLELTDRRVRNVDDIVDSLELPVLGTLPRPNAKRYAAGNRSLPVPPRTLGLPGPSAATRGA